MARILFCWELGGGLGHLMPVKSAGRILQDAGHDVAYALRDISLADNNTSAKARIFQAPFFPPHLQTGSPPPETYADMLQSIGYRDEACLATMLAAWQEIFTAFDPGLLVFDHAPTAMLAARGRSEPQIALATSGFTLPPPQHPLPMIRTEPGHEKDSARQAAIRREDTVTAVINAALELRNLPPIAAIGELFETDTQLLLSIPELDPYAPRTSSSVEYWGPQQASANNSRGTAATWPASTDNDKRVFVYTQKFPELENLLTVLTESGASVLAHINRLATKECHDLSNDRVRISPEPLDVSRVLAECDAVIVHGGALAASALLAGKPVLTLPLHLEHHLTGERLQALGAGLNAPLRKAQGMRSKLHRLLHEKSFTEAAERIAAKYKNTFVPFEDRFTQLVENLLKTKRT